MQHGNEKVSERNINAGRTVTFYNNICKIVLAKFLKFIIMRRPKISLKKYFFLTLIFALLLIFGFNLREHEEWKFKASPVTQKPQQQQQQQQEVEQHENDINNAIIAPSNVIPGDTPTNFQGSASPDESHDDLSEMNVQPTDGTRSWFFKHGRDYPKAAAPAKSNNKGFGLMPYQNNHSDRIVDQLMFVPPNYDEIRESGKLKTILLFNGLSVWNIKRGRDIFRRLKCPVDTCEVTPIRAHASKADLIVHKDFYMPSGFRRPANSKQLNMLYFLECPYHTQNIKVPDAINWTATYRRDSDIVAPYEKWVYYDPNVRQIEQERNYALNKTKKVAWFVSNCGARNGRLQFAHELQKYIDVDIYGACGNFKCSRINADKCFEILDSDYKFYLAFENSNCKDYITEKFFVNALNRNILPIVMGARPEDYEISAPYRSYIHVDEFASPRELAEYLHILDKDHDLYNSYFKWKGTGEFINTYFWCRVCALLHDEESLRKPHWYSDVNDWWRGAGVCTNGSWRNLKARKDVIED